MLVGSSDDSEAVGLVCGERCGVVLANIGKYLLVALLPRSLECDRKQALGDALPPASKIDISADDPNVIEGVRVRGKRGHALEPDDTVITGAHGDVENVTVRESCDVRTFGFDSERCVEQRIGVRLDDRIEH